LHDIDLYPKSIIAAAKTYDFDVYTEELMEYLVADGDKYLTELEGGLFETVYLSDDKDNLSDNDILYILGR